MADGLCGLNSAENARFETQPSFRVQAASNNHKCINAGGLRVVRKTPGHKPSTSAGKVSSLRRLAHELNRFRDLQPNCGFFANCPLGLPCPQHDMAPEATR